MATILYRKNKKDGQLILTRDFGSQSSIMGKGTGIAWQWEGVAEALLCTAEEGEKPGPEQGAAYSLQGHTLEI